MSRAKLLGLGLLVAVLAVPGCGDKAGGDKVGGDKGKERKDDDKKGHTHGKGPHGGVVFDIGAYHGEFTVDHDKKECTVYILGEDEKTLQAVDAKELTLTTRATKTKEGKAVPALTITLTPRDAKGGKAATFGGTAPGLGNVVDFAGKVLGEIDGKPAEGDFKE